MSHARRGPPCTPRSAADSCSSGRGESKYKHRPRKPTLFALPLLCVVSPTEARRSSTVHRREAHLRGSARGPGGPPRPAAQQQYPDRQPGSTAAKRALARHVAAARGCTARREPSARTAAPATPPRAHRADARGPTPSRDKTPRAAARRREAKPRRAASGLR
ncbi:hypothetical protein WOLCODRAFT_151915 [Wolfiporia cocos MD-104 SS10]|uniref:Uncharacterized protein n=1 Tax=Wolfiporia cocos (strain MD-104) TaxID=742152 RepID=A0A2H3JJZ7_WOLCO|nr:hypothetical protein WOLCODRAFT_151915 [Wolfiporia cocos MD-104 SS10]